VRPRMGRHGHLLRQRIANTGKVTNFN
jgi:hypothetical protein